MRRNPDIFDAFADGVISGEVQAGLPHGYWSDGCISGDFCVSRNELLRACVCGPDPVRTCTTMEIILRFAEVGERFLVLDLRGQFAPLMDYIPSLRVYKIGRYASLNPLAPCGDRDEFPKMISAVFQEQYRLERDERLYLEKALSAAYGDGVATAVVGDLRDKLLQIEAESNPREGYKIEGLRNVLWELETGVMGKILSKRESLMPNLPAVLDMSAVKTARGKVLLAAYAILCAPIWKPTAVIVDPADWVLRPEPTVSPEYTMLMEDHIDLVARLEVALCLSTANPKSLPRWITESLTARIMCGPLWERELSGIERAFILGDAERRALRHIQRGEVLACLSGLDSPKVLRLRPSKFRHVADAEVARHMRAMGEGGEELRGIPNGARLLEKLFRDRGTQLYALELLKLMKGGRVPVDAVVKQRNVAMRHIVRALTKYFLIVEYSDNGGTNWYRLTKAGDRALAEMEEAGDRREVFESESETDV